VSSPKHGAGIGGNRPPAAKQWTALCTVLDLDAAVAELSRESGLDLSREGNRFRAREEIAALVRTRVVTRSLAELAGDHHDESGLAGEPAPGLGAVQQPPA
jgi:hypothetical protein